MKVKPTAKIMRSAPAILWGMIALQACNYEAAKTPAPSLNYAKISGVTFSQVETQVFAVSCNSCHTQQGGPDLTNFSTVQSKLSQIQSDVFDKHSMPKNGALSTNQLSLLSSWIQDGGTLDGVASPQPSPVPLIELADLTYANLDARIFKPQCSKCHSNKEGVDLTTYAGVTGQLAKIGLVALGDLSMPPKTPLNPADQALLKAWINMGAPQTSIADVVIQPTYASIDANIFQPICMNCHGAGNLAKRVPLEPYSAMMAALVGKEKAPLIVAGHSDQSLLFQIITTSNADDLMPPPDDTGLDALPSSMISMIQTWIDSGAPEK